MRHIVSSLCLLFYLSQCTSNAEKAETSISSKPADRWTEEKVNQWYDQQPWLVGTNFGPSNAINQLEMWQRETFDPETIEKELALSASIGMNTHRVFLHNLLWEQDSTGFLDRIDQFLTIAERHGIKSILVLFDGVWHPVPVLGIQPEPVAHKHNSGWVQSPGAKYLADKSLYPELERYVKGVISRFAEDQRVLIWDLFNEPDNENSGSYPDLELTDKYDKAFDLLKAAFEWAREVNPDQPLTAGVWRGIIDEEGLASLEPDAISKFMLQNSDIISFHTYEHPEVVPRRIQYLQKYNRPLICTEYLARSRDNTFENILPLFNKHKIGAYNWGFVSGKTNTIYPWDSWDSVYVAEPGLWHHDIFRSDLTAYREAEVQLIKELTGL